MEPSRSEKRFGFANKVRDWNKKETVKGIVRSIQKRIGIAKTEWTAGVFLIVRCSPLFEYAPNILTAIAVMGAITSFFAATTGAFQNDLKRVIAYSTCSQLGYMVFACGISSYSVTMFHLMNHAFFKALLFLSAGSIIHAMHDEQDMRRMGALNRILPFTYTMTLIGSFALIGFPFLTGYYSKDVRECGTYIVDSQNPGAAVLRQLQQG